MLVPYEERSLAKANRAEVDAHLKECQFCREEARRLHDLMRPLSELVKSGIKPIYDPHPTHEQLFRYASHDRSLSKEEQRNIRLHIFMCGDCNKEISLIEQVDHDFEGVSATDSSRWTMPPLLRNLFASPSRTSVIVENALEERIPNIERLRAIMQKVNLHLVGVIAAIILLLFICLSFITCGGGDDEQQAKAAPEPSATVAAAVSAPVQEEWVALSLGDFSPVEACTVLSSQNITYRSSKGRLEVKSTDLEKAQAAVNKYRESYNLPESTLALEDSSNQDDYTESSSYSEDNSSSNNSDSDIQNYEQSEESNPIEVEPYVPSADNSPASQPAVSQEPAPAPKAVSAPTRKAAQTFSQPRVAVPARRAAVRPVYSAQPKIKTKVASRPTRAYDTAAYQPAPSPVSKASQKAHPGAAGPTPISASYAAGTNHPESSPRSSVAPSPAIIRPGSDITVSSMRRHASKTENNNESVITAEEAPYGSENTISGNTYDDADSVTNRDTIE